MVQPTSLVASRQVPLGKVKSKAAPDAEALKGGMMLIDVLLVASVTIYSAVPIWK